MSATRSDLSGKLFTGISALSRLEHDSDTMTYALSGRAAEHRHLVTVVLTAIRFNNIRLKWTQVYLILF